MMPKEGWFDKLARKNDIDNVHYGRDGQPITFAAWVALFEDKDYQIVSRDEISWGEDKILVSTVWIGIDYGWGETPLIFETMVFAEGFPLNEVQWRYHTEEEAKIGHVDALERVKELIELDSTMG